MDPQMLLDRILENAITVSRTSRDQTAINLADDVRALAEWLGRGGFAPEWKKGLVDARL